MLASSFLPSAAEQGRLIHELHKTGVPQKADEKVYLLNVQWYYTWQSYTEGKRKVPPPPIDNSELLDPESMELKDDLVSMYDYILAIEPVWKAFRQWYGGGPEIYRYTIINSARQIELEVYPYNFLVSKVDMDYGEWSHTYERELLISKVRTVGQLYEKLLEMFRPVYSEELKTEVHHFRLQVATMGEIFKIVNLDKNNLRNITLERTGWKQSRSHEVRLMLEAKGTDNIWPTERKRVIKETQGVEYAPSGGYSSGRLHLASDSGYRPGDIGSRSTYSGLGGKRVTVNIGNKVRSMIPGVCGLENIGNTCYMNATLQALAHCKPIAKYFLTNEFLADITSKATSPIIFSFASVMQLLLGGEHSVVTPGDFKEQLGHINRFFSGYRQHDAEEFVSYILDRLSDETNRNAAGRTEGALLPEIDSMDASKPTNLRLQSEAQRSRIIHRQKYDSFILDLFEGQYTSQLQCKVCETMSASFDPFMVMSLAIPTEAKGSRDTITLEDCLSEFLSEEVLSGSNKWYCAKCNELRPAVKKISLYSEFMPKVLIIQLKRFTALGVKVNEPVKFGKELDLSKFVTASSNQLEEVRYSLFSVTQHRGVCGGGHYIAHTKCDDGVWRVFNDSSIHAVDLDTSDPTAYLLYYERL